MDESLIRLVWQRAQNCCEYCRLPQRYSSLTFEIDHIIAKKHGGATTLGNLALACFYCNNRKGPNIAGVDPQTGSIIRLFHPRRHKWSRHFYWEGTELRGRTAIGRATISVLNINEDEALSTRQLLMDDGLYPRD